MSVISEKITQYRLFARRGYQIYYEKLDRFFTDEDMENTLLRDSGLVHNAKLVMKLPPKEPVEQEENDDEEEEDFDNMMDFDEAGMGAEGGEDEMIEIEEGEDEMSEPVDQDD